MTIKEAFEALSSACAKGMKNPFFVMKRLKESFADVADKVVDASGDKVTVTQTLTEGTEIGSIKVNNNTTTLYAPAGGGSNSHAYSSTETEVGTWIDGTSKVYEITLSGDCPRQGSAGYAELPSGILRIISADVICAEDGGNPRFYKLPYMSIAGLQYSTQFKFDTTNSKVNLEIKNGNSSDITNSWSYTAIVRYVKSSS